MANKPHPTAHIEVDDPAVAIERAKELGRRLLGVPKKKIDEKIARERAKPTRRK